MTIKPEFSLDQPRQINYLAPDGVLAKDRVFRLGVHYLKPRGRVLFQWPAVEAWLVQGR